MKSDRQQKPLSPASSVLRSKGWLHFTLAATVLGGLTFLAHDSLASAAPVADGKGDAQRGEAAFEKRCSGCHSLDEDKEGPRLRGVYGRKAATITTFQFSDALKKSNITWDDEKLDRWMGEPEKLVPDSEMTFRVIKAEERQDIVAYLRQVPPTK
ncbi:MAG TPA: c-type cytochrome [Candidatus Angelobacter sp.]|nr:c-type cytochrome [Candidatus Angelobacter sp.]